MTRILRSISIWGVLTIALAFMGGKPGIPREFLQPGELEDILDDYHVAEGMA